jgi:hypothetical protein
VLIKRLKKYSIILSAVFYLSVCNSDIYSQNDSIKYLPDTSIVPGNASLNPLPLGSKSIDSTEFHPAKSPTLALGLSGIFPGAGQIYTENYWKVPIIWGVGGYWIYEWFQLNDKYKQFQRDYLKTQSDQDLRLREFYRDERDKFAWFLGVLYVLNLVDAYAGAHLYDFNVSPDLSLNGRVVPKVTATVRLRF